MYQQHPGPPAVPPPQACVMKVEIFITCTDLEDRDVTSKSDPYAVLYNVVSGKNTVCGKTEVQKDQLNPTFKQSIVTDFFFEQKQVFKVALYDYDGEGKLGDELGEASFVMGQVMGSRGSSAKFPLSPRKGNVTITAVECGQSNDDVEICFSGTKMKKMDTFGKSDPYFFFNRILPNGSKTQIHKSEVKSNTLEPRWGANPVTSVSHLCSGNMTDRCLEFTCFDSDAVGSDDAMGGFACSLQDIFEAHAKKTGFELMDGRGKKYGLIMVERVTLIKRPTFIDFLKGGLQINLAVSIDFTGSNGNPSQPTSLHFINPSAPNQYEHAIMSVGEILSYYDADKQFPAFGFGAKLPDGQVSHYFHLNLQPNPYVTAVPGILGAYRNCLSQVSLYGPTNFAPTITSVSRAARQAPGVYTVLLIITDGEITDVANTINAIVEADDAPLSIVIVGVGEADFAAMNMLDGDGGKLRSGTGRVSRRDIVQFVPMRDFATRGQEALSTEVLREIPGQVVAWAAIAKYQPGGPQ